MAAIVPIATALVGGYFSNKANKRATKTQADATKAATDYQTKRDSVTDKRYDDEVADKKMRWDAYQRDLAEWKARHGYGPAASGGGGGGGGGLAGGLTVADFDALHKSGVGAAPAPPTLRDLGPGFGGTRLPAYDPKNPNAGPAPVFGGMSLPALPPSGSGSSPADVSAMPTLADLGKWNDWEPYLNPQQA